MDFMNKVLNSDGDQNNGNNRSDDKGNNNDSNNNSNGGGGDGLMGMINSVGGGGSQGEKNEDGLDKAVDFVQEHVLGQGNQSNESAVEQAKDEAMSDFIRDKYKETTGSDFPIADKDKKFGL